MKSPADDTRHRAHGALAVPSRVLLLDTLRAGAHGLDVRELATACGLHVSTVRFHLGILADAGLVRSGAAPAHGRGRPRLVYTATTHADAGDSGYQLLASVLAAHWGGAAAGRAEKAERAGRAMAVEHRSTAARTGTGSVAESVAQVGALFAELGFEPEVVEAGNGNADHGPTGARHPRRGDIEIRLHACPFHAVAAEHPDVVCSLHLGLLRGALAELAAPATVTSLSPFVEPHLCVARISTEPDPAGLR